MRTQTEKLLRHKATRKGVLVPLLEDLFQRPVEIEDEYDVDWLTRLLKLQLERGERRGSVFSPSQMSECLRYVYLLKHHRQLEIERARLVRVEPNFYFFNGNFLHLKWQFALYKLHRHIGDAEIFCLHGVEVPIESKRKDHGGTVDALCSIHAEPYIVDVKGLNVRSFGQIALGHIPPQYTIQLTDYAMLYNAALRNGGRPKISNAILLTENKGGPDPKHLIALQESIIPVRTHLPEVHRRLGVLREHEEGNVIPEPECQSTKTIQFLGCPFRKFCREEVRANERRNAQNRDTEKPQVAVPQRSRNNRTRGNSKRRGQPTS